MSEQNDVPADGSQMTDEQVVSYTQGVRKKLVDVITDEGKSMPSDKGDRIVLLTALTDMDRTALGKMKIGAKERQGQADRDAAIIAAKLIGRYGQQGPFAKIPGKVGEIIEGEVVGPPTLDESDLPPLVLVPGETATGVSAENYEQFMGKMEGSTPDESAG